MTVSPVRGNPADATLHGAGAPSALRDRVLEYTKDPADPTWTNADSRHSLMGGVSYGLAAGAGVGLFAALMLGNTNRGRPIQIVGAAAAALTAGMALGTVVKTVRDGDRHQAIERQVRENEVTRYRSLETTPIGKVDYVRVWTERVPGTDGTAVARVRDANGHVRREEVELEGQWLNKSEPSVGTAELRALDATQVSPTGYSTQQQADDVAQGLVGEHIPNVAVVRLEGERHGVYQLQIGRNTIPDADLAGIRNLHPAVASLFSFDKAAGKVQRDL